MSTELSGFLPGLNAPDVKFTLFLIGPRPPLTAAAIRRKQESKHGSHHLTDDLKPLAVTVDERRARAAAKQLKSLIASGFHRAILIISLAITLVGYVQLADKESQSVLIKSPEERSQQFILLGAANYEGDLTFALVEQGFQVKPIAVTQEVRELESETRIVSYKKAGFPLCPQISCVK